MSRVSHCRLSLATTSSYEWVYCQGSSHTFLCWTSHEPSRWVGGSGGISRGMQLSTPVLPEGEQGIPAQFQWVCTGP